MASPDVKETDFPSKESTLLFELQQLDKKNNSTPVKRNKMVTVTNLGMPRMGANRELKRLIENYWAGKVNEKSLLLGAKVLLFGVGLDWVVVLG